MAGIRRCLLIECGVAETRSALLLGDEVIRFWFHTARGDEALPRPAQAGDIYLGRVQSVSKSLGGAFVDLGEGRDGFLPYKEDARYPNEGAAIVVRIRRPALGEKGAVLTAGWRKGLNERAIAAIEEQSKDAVVPSFISVHLCKNWAPWLNSVLAMVPAAASCGEVEVVIDSGESARALREERPDIVSRVEENPFEIYSAADALEWSLERTIVLSGGARLTFDQAEAMTVVDVDSGGAADGASGRLNDKVNTAAAKALPAEFSRRGIGGRIVVDFLPSSGAEARKRLMET
ncbi:MAG: ribonuclease E/G, partial [Amphiplicatus sp.]